MALVKVRNNNSHTFEQDYQGRKISIQPGQFVEMDEEDAVVYLGMKSTIKIDNKGNHDPKYFKMLSIERGNSPATKTIDNKFMCNACREQTSSWVELEAHTRLMHSDLEQFSDPVLEKDLAQKKRDHGAKATAGAVPG